MKNILFYIAVVTGLGSFTSLLEKDFFISGTVKGFKNGEMIFLIKQNMETGVSSRLDSVKITGGKFKLKGIAAEPQIVILKIEDTIQIPLVLENGHIEVSFDRTNAINAKISGTYNNEELTAFKAITNEYLQKMKRFKDANTAKMTEAMNAKDTITMDALRKGYNDIQNEFYAETEQYVATHPKAFISVLMLQSMLPRVKPQLVEKYFNALDLSVRNTKTAKDFKKKLDEFQKELSAKMKRPISKKKKNTRKGIK